MSGTATNLSSSRSRTLPVRAITSTLASRSSPSIPPSSQVYEPQVKQVLRHRLTYNIFGYSLLLSWITTASWIIWSQGGPSVLKISGVFMAPFQPLTLMCAVVSWTVGALPAIIVRKVYLTPSRTPSTSPSTSIKIALSKPNTARALTTYIISATLIAVLHSTIAYMNEPHVRGDPRLSLFVKSKKHPHYLNGRLIFLVFSQVIAALGFSLRNIMVDRFAFRWQISSRSSSTSQIFTILAVASLFASMTNAASAVIFALCRFTLPVLYKLPLLHIFLRPFTAHFLRGSWTLFLPLRHATLLLRAWFLAFTTLLAWESSEILFDSFITQPISVSRMSADPTLTLISGISSSDATFKYFAYSELKELSASESSGASAQRTALFGDQKYNPNLWSHLLRESLLLLGRDYQLFLRRGQPPTPVLAPLPIPTTPSGPPATPARLLRTPIYQSSKNSPIRTVVDSFASDGSLAQAVDVGADAANIPELFRSVEAAVLPAPAKEEIKKTVESGKSLVRRTTDVVQGRVYSVVGAYVPPWAADAAANWSSWWARERISRVVDRCLPSRELDVAVIQVLSHLTCASLTEDRYGVVQRDIPKILEAMLSFLSAIEEYQGTISAMYTPPSLEDPLSARELEMNAELRIEVDKAGEILGFVADGLKEGIARIVRTFGDKLLAFKFPPRTAKKLQGFLDYC